MYIYIQIVSLGFYNNRITTTILFKNTTNVNTNEKTTLYFVTLFLLIWVIRRDCLGKINHRVENMSMKSHITVNGDVDGMRRRSKTLVDDDHTISI